VKSILLLCTGLTAVACFAPQALAQDNDSQVETVIVTGNRPALNAIPMKAPFVESTITPEAILNITPSPAMTVQTLLATQPSIYATVGGTNGMETDIKFRSFVDGEFGETFAGVPLNDLFNGGVTYQADNRNNALLTTRDLDSVEIYRGINNPAVNTYNSLGGTINYVPRQPKDDFGGDVGVDGGSFGTFDYHMTLDTGDWHGIEQTISLERDYSSGWLQNTPDRNDNLYYAAKADVDADTNIFSYFVLNKNRGDAPQFIPQNILDQNWSFQWPGGTYQANNDDTNFLGVLGFNTKIGNYITLEDTAYGGDNNYQRTSFSNPDYSQQYFTDDRGDPSAFWLSYGPPGMYNPAAVFPYTSGQAYGESTGATGYDCAPNCAFAGTDYHFYGYNGSLYGDRVKATVDVPYNLFTFGGDWNVGELHSREYWYGTYNMPKIVGYNDAWDEHDTRQIFSAWAQDDIHFWDDRIHITPGLRYDGSVVKDNDALGFFYVPPGSIKGDEHYLSPTIGANVEVMPDFTVFAAYGKNTKFPDITALYNELGYGGAVPPVTARPEFAEDYEFGARYKWDTLTTEVNVYQENFSNILYSVYIPNGFGATEQLNGGSERYRGVELQMTDEFGQIFIGNWKGYLNASYNQAECASNFNASNVVGTSDAGGVCTIGQQLPNVPRYLANAGLIWDYDGWHVDLQGHYVGQQTLQDYYTSLPENGGYIEPGQMTKIPDYFLVNFGVVKVIPISWGPANAVRLMLHVDNLFDTKYYSEATTNTDANNGFCTVNHVTQQCLDFYGITGEPRAVFGSVSIYF
jgi:outer membrane receptor for ferrienterochelin and colicin